MIANVVCVITVSLEHPIPFISTGNYQIKRTLDKIARFTHNFVICGIPSASLMGATHQGIMKLYDFSCQISEKPGIQWKSTYPVCLRSV